MTLSLFDATVAGFQQTLGAVSGFLDKGLAHCMDKGEDPEALVQARLFPDMFPLLFQIQSVAHHSIGAIEGVKAGQFQPPGNIPPMDYAGMVRLVSEAREALGKLTPEEVNDLAGRDVIFHFRDFKMPFTAEGFLLSFSMPNFHFHATTAYDILRSQGVPLGKRDYMGALRLKS